MNTLDVYISVLIQIHIWLDCLNQAYYTYVYIFQMSRVFKKKQQRKACLRVA